MRWLFREFPAAPWPLWVMLAGFLLWMESDPVRLIQILLALFDEAIQSGFEPEYWATLVWFPPLPSSLARSAHHGVGSY